MKICRKTTFGEVVAYELGWAPLGRPFMTVYLYRVGRFLIDTGQSLMRKEVLQLVNTFPIEAVLLTHYHEDHSGNASAVKRQRNVPVLGHPSTVLKMKKGFKILPYQVYFWGKAEPLSMDPLPNLVEGVSIRLEPIHTAGHSKDHMVYLESNRGWLFSGDLYLADSVKYFRADEKIGDQITSLKKVLTLDFESLFCSHRPRPKKGKEHIRRKLQFLEDMYGKVSALSGEGLGEKEIMVKLKLKEAHLVKLFCLGNVSMVNAVRSVISSLEKRDA
jgi:glyoxylase-like metal-dependent hydrolase (beta-lactamase superfamily II)